MRLRFRCKIFLGKCKKNVLKKSENVLIVWFVNFRKTFLKISFTLLLTVNTYGIFLECNYNLDRWTDVGQFYSCDVRNLIVAVDDFVVQSVSKNHLESFSNVDVISIDVYKQHCPVIPLGMTKFFRSIEVLTISESSLERITKKDLKPFRNLYSLVLPGNKLRSLSGDLFEFSPRIDYIDFRQNEIKTVGGNILNPLKKVRGVFFKGNICIDIDNSDVSAESLSVFRQVLVANCADATSTRDTSSNIVNSNK